MKHQTFLLSISLLTSTLFSAAFIVSCASAKAAEEPVQQQPAAETPAPVETPAEVPVPAAQEDEYARSVGTTAVSKDTFAEDKTNILAIIAKLDIIMKDFDYKSWTLYVEPDSLAYWQQPENLKKAQSRLPIKGLQLRSLEDYFKYVFVPSRAGRVVTEIRYIDDTTVKAVQVQENQDIIYYYFKKIDRSWMLRLPPIEN